MTASREPREAVWPAGDADRQIVGALRFARRRLVVAALLRGGAVAATMSLLPLMAGAAGLAPARTSIAISVAIAVASLAAWMWKSAEGRSSVARCVEARVPSLRNELVTAAEIIEGRIAAVPDLSVVIRASVAARLSRLDLRALFPLARRVPACALAVAIWAAGAWFVSHEPPLGLLTQFSGAPAIGIVDVRIEPPAYTKIATSSVQNPDRLAVIEGSRLHLGISSSAASITIERVISDEVGATGVPAAPIVETLTRDGRGHFAGDVTATRDGYLAFQPMDAAGKPGVRRLLPLAVTPDRAPIVTLEKPGRDLAVIDTSNAIPIRAGAEDDLGLRTLKVRYTKVSGSGEDFTFTEGELALQVTAAKATAWSGAGTLSLAALKLAAGDMVVYRAVATDDRPGAPPAESDAFVIEVKRPGESLGEGFAVDDTPDRYKLSQQMIIIKTQQLIAKKAALAPDAFTEQSVAIAAEQRRVRAEFVFMMGGELAEDEVALADDPTQLHEETEAMGEADLMAGRMKNQGRRDLIEAVRRMSDAAASLSVPDAPIALTQERAALDALQRAFSKSRYLLRTIPVRERIDATRRLSGSLAGLLPWHRNATDATANPRVAEIRRTVDQLTAFGLRASFGPSDSTEVSRLSEALLRVDARSLALQQAAARLDRAAVELAARRTPSQLRVWIDDATVLLTAMAVADLQDAPIAAQSPAAARLNGTLADLARGTSAIKRQP